MVTTRSCSNGHAVAEDYLQGLPQCSSALRPPGSRGRSRPRWHRRPSNQVTVSRTVPFVAGGIMLGMLGRLLAYAAERGPAEVFGLVLMGLAVVIVLVGLADAVRRRR